MKETQSHLLKSEEILTTTEILLKSRHLWGDASVTEIARDFQSPFHVLVACLLSLRTKDKVTREASTRLFTVANTPLELLRIPIRDLEKIIFPVGFYRNKAKTLNTISQTLLDLFDGNVPDEMEQLLALRGVGRKTANLVLSKGFGKAAICVDTHVHRIPNRLGWINTKSPEQTEEALRELLPKRLWTRVNDLLVPFGQKVCQPVSPWCSKCVLEDYCLKVGITRSR